MSKDESLPLSRAAARGQGRLRGVKLAAVRGQAWLLVYGGLGGSGSSLVIGLRRSSRYLIAARGVIAAARGQAWLLVYGGLRGIKAWRLFSINLIQSRREWQVGRLGS